MYCCITAVASGLLFKAPFHRLIANNAHQKSIFCTCVSVFSPYTRRRWKTSEYILNFEIKRRPWIWRHLVMHWISFLNCDPVDISSFRRFYGTLRGLISYLKEPSAQRRCALFLLAFFHHFFNYQPNQRESTINAPQIPSRLERFK